MEEVTAAIGEEVIPDPQNQAEGHGIEEKRLEPFLEPQRVGHTFIHKMLLQFGKIHLEDLLEYVEVLS